MVILFSHVACLSYQDDETFETGRDLHLKFQTELSTASSFYRTRLIARFVPSTYINSPNTQTPTKTNEESNEMQGYTEERKIYPMQNPYEQKKPEEAREGMKSLEAPSEQVNVDIGTMIDLVHRRDHSRENHQPFPLPCLQGAQHPPKRPTSDRRPKKNDQRSQRMSSPRRTSNQR